MRWWRRTAVRVSAGWQTATSFLLGTKHSYLSFHLKDSCKALFPLLFLFIKVVVFWNGWAGFTILPLPVRWLAVPVWWLAVPVRWLTVPERWFAISERWFTIPVRWFAVPVRWWLTKEFSFPRWWTSQWKRLNFKEQKKEGKEQL